MHKETEAWENDQLDPERKLVEMDSAPPSEPGTSNGSPHTNLDKKQGSVPVPETAQPSAPEPNNSSTVNTSESQQPMQVGTTQDDAKTKDNARGTDASEVVETRPASSQ
jgi:hypothetical protein